jgi:hypothetical protein
MNNKHHRQERTKCALAALMALVISAIALSLGYLLWNMPEAGEQDSPADIQITAGDFILPPHIGKPLSTGIEVAAPGPNRQVVLPIELTGFQADRYPVLQYRIENRSPGLKTILYWRSSSSPDTTRFRLLPPGFLNQVSLSLEDSPGWKGKLTHLGLSLQGGRSGDRLIIRHLKFSRPGTANRIGTILSDWSSLEPWSMSSINFIFNAKPDSRPSPVIAAAGWLGLALLFLVAGNLIRFHTPLPPGCGTGLLILVLIPWLVLYGRWQLNLWTQLDETRKLYAGKSQEEKHLLAEDAGIYRYANHLKTDLLPPAPARIIILSKSFRDYLRLKLQYHLLPHNSYNYDSFPQAAYLHGGDYLLVLGNIPGLRYNQARQRLEWTQGRYIRARLLDRAPMGSLYQVEAPGKDQT